MRRVVLLIVCIATALIACGLPNDSEPRQIADDKVPFGLLGPSTTNPPSNVGGALVQLYFVDGTQLRRVQRSLSDREPATVLNELVKGVTDRDPSGVTTAIPKDSQIVNIAFDGDNLVVTVNAAFLTIGDPGQRTAFAQLVYTLTDLGVPGVRFRAVDANGANETDVSPSTDVGQKQGPLTRSDFAQLAPKS
jgi:hypothetical protein